jgi:hypothetical protein
MVIVCAMAISSTPKVASGSGVLDQHLTGNPECSLAALQGSVGIGHGYLSQEFVPSMPTLTGVDICVHIFNETDPVVEVNVRTGTATGSGLALIAAIAEPSMNDEWIHVEFDPIAVTPGTKLVIDVGGYFGWRSTCPSVAAQCDHIDPDLYPLGQSDSGVRDFGFRTYGTDDSAPQPGPPPLNVQWGNLDCSSSPYLSGADAIAPLRLAAGLSPSSVSSASADCPDIGQQVEALGRQRIWGDVDCLDKSPLFDALAIVSELATNAGGDYERDTACPIADQYVTIQ